MAGTLLSGQVLPRLLSSTTKAGLSSATASCTLEEERKGAVGITSGLLRIAGFGGAFVLPKRRKSSPLHHHRQLMVWGKYT